MIIRPSTAEDIPSIVALLKMSLGEKLMPKSEASWRWKHVDQPFGASSVLLAWEQEQLVGVRAFMNWQWRQGSRIYNAVRAVDTVTHPQFQGRGIFKTLTLSLVDRCKSQNVDFIFNTPNNQSRKGYIKMGWKQVGRMKVFVRPALNSGRQSDDFESRYGLDAERVRELFTGLQFKYPDHMMVTNRSAEFLAWRYLGHPLLKYHVFFDDLKSFVGLFRLKRYKFGTELRICDLFLSQSVSIPRFRQHLTRVTGDAGAWVVTFAGADFPVASSALGIGPLVTARPVSAHNSLSFDSWKPSLGDMEVF